MHKPNLEAILSQILPVLANPEAFEEFLKQTPFTDFEKANLRQSYRQITHPPADHNHPSPLGPILQNLLREIDPEQLEDLLPLIKQLQNTPPENLIRLFNFLKN